MTGKGKIIVVSAPSGTGKTTIIKQVLESFSNLRFSISATTRAKRENEVDGVDYMFIPKEEFLVKIKGDEFIEWEDVYGYYYGTLRNSVEEIVKSGMNVLLELDVKGAVAIKKKYSDSLLLFIEPPSIAELIKRLKNRKTETEEDLKKRIDRAIMELQYKDLFDYNIVNDDLSSATKEVVKIVKEII